MTEKDYSGTATGKIGKNAKANSSAISKQIKEIEASKKLGSLGKEKKVKAENEDEEDSSITDINSYKKAGAIVSKVKEYARTIIKKDVLLAEIAEKIESKIIELGGEIAFPVNLSINDIAAHYTPAFHDDTKAEGLLKVDLGVHVKGFIADSAFTLDLTPEKKYTKLIESAESALKAAIEEVKAKKEKAVITEIGRVIQEKIQAQGFSPVRNLSGHGLGKYQIHSGITIPNYDNKNTKELGEGAFAIEPFATAGKGVVYDGEGSNIFHIARDGQVRDNFSREVYAYILENKKLLPFSKREIEKKFGSKGLFALRNLENAGIINEFAQLVEESHSPVSQAETSFVIYEGKVEMVEE